MSSKLLDALKILAGLVVLVVFVLGAQRVYCWLFPGAGVEAVVRSHLLGIEEVETLYTGFSYVPVLQFLVDDDQVVEDLAAEPLTGAKGFCYRLYRVTLGFPDAGEALEAFRDGSQVALEVLASNALESRRHGDFHQERCDRLDRRPPDEVHAWLRGRMQEDGQWPIHEGHARRLLADLAPGAGALDRDGEADRRADLDEGGGQYLGIGHVGVLKVTFSLIGLYSQERGRWFWRRDQFYVRRDLAEAVYGSAVTADSFQTRSPWLRESYLEVTLEEPRLVAIDRYIQTLVVKPASFKFREEVDVEQDLLAELQRSLEEIEPDVIATSKRLIRLRIGRAAGEAPFRVRFVRRVPQRAPIAVE